MYDTGLLRKLSNSPIWLLPGIIDKKNGILYIIEYIFDNSKHGYQYVNSID